MRPIADFIVRKRAWFCALFAALIAVSAFCIPLVRLNYDDTLYLPDSSNTKAGLQAMEADFGPGGSATALLEADGDMAEILRVQAEMEAVDGVEQVLWLSDILLPLANDGGDDAHTMDTLLTLLRALPTRGDATAYDLATTAQSAFDDAERPGALRLLERVMAGVSGETIDLTALMALTDPADESELASLGALRSAFGGASDDTAAFLASAIDGLTAANQGGMALSAQAMAQTLLAAAQALPENAATAYELYQGLSKAFSQQELPGVLTLLGGFGLDLSKVDFTDPQAMMAPLPAETARAIAEAKARLGAAAPSLSGEAAKPTFALLDKIAAMNQPQTRVTGAQAVTCLQKLASALPTEAGATRYDIVKALSEAFSADELPLALQLLGADGVTAESVQAATRPLGEEYAAAVGGMAGEIDGFYKEGSALFTLQFDEDDYAERTHKAVGELTALSSRLYVTGNAVSAYGARSSQTTEIVNASIMVVILALALLFALSSSWIEPLLYVVAIVAAIVLNLGTNLVFGSVSYLTQSVACVLQLALSIDYAVFLINRYKKERAGGLDAEAAMKTALCRSLSPISASSLTTIACFVTIMFMRYRLGLDMGAVMAKGIVFSLLTVFLLLPGVIVYCDRLIQRSAHRTFAFACRGLAKTTYKGRWALVVAAVLIVAPCVYLSGRNTFVYGNTASQSADGISVVNRERVEAVFGTQEQLAVLIEKDAEKETRLADALAALDGVASVRAWAQIEQSGFTRLLPEAMKAQLVGRKTFDRLALTLTCPEEGAETEALLGRIGDAIEAEYGAGARYYLLGNAAAASDIKQSTSDDFGLISALSMIAVALIVAAAFRSALIPVLLVAVIEGAVCVNMAIPALAGSPMVFLGYMIISNVLLGSTIDYAILLTSHYLEARRETAREDAVRLAQSGSARSILTSGSIFTVGGLMLGLMTSMPTVELLGYAIMRGGICAMVMSMVVLPALLTIFDKPMGRLAQRENKQKE